MTRRLLAIALVFGATTLAWMILGGSIFSRTHETDGRLKDGVTGLWGGAQIQAAPYATFSEKETQRIESEDRDGNIKVKHVEKVVEHPIALEASKIKTDFDLSHRQKGLLWYATYKVNYAGQYRFVNDSGKT